MRSLYISQFYLWPSRGGYGKRLGQFVDSLTNVGDVDFLCLDGSGRFRDPPPAGVNVINAPEGPRRALSEWLPAWISGDLPRRLAQRNFSAAHDFALTHIDIASYDLVVVSHIDSWCAVGDILSGATILDFDNLENTAVASKRVQRAGRQANENSSSEPRDERFGGGLNVLRNMREKLVDRADEIDEKRWDTIQRRAASGVDVVTVCSELDVQRSNCPNAVSIENGYTLPTSNQDAVCDEPLVPQTTGRVGNVVLFVGLLTYEPNRDAVTWCVNEILPQILKRHPTVEFRVVGEGAEQLSIDPSAPHVSILGRVEDLQAELDAATISVVPIRFGAGTRLKVLEAMAHRLPMVSTTLGCEGIDVSHGEEVLIGDSTAEFVDAVCTLLDDNDYATQLATAAYDCWRSTYQWSTIGKKLEELFVSVGNNGR